jgi:aminomethyltransferase
LTSDLEKIFPLDLKNLKLNSSKYSFLMNDEAGVHDDLIITKLEDGFLIILNAACKDNDFKILSSLLKNKYKMVLDDQRSLIAIQGPKSVEILNLIINSVADLSFMSGNWFVYKGQKLYVTRSGYTGEDGFEVSISNELAEGFTKELLDNGAKLIGLGARDTLRLEAGLCLYGHELSTDTTPIEANLKWAISKERLNKGGFIGSDYIINQINDGAKKIRVGIKPEGRLIARENTKIYNENEQMIGEVTSGTFGPSVNGPIAMGFIDQKFSKKDTRILLEVRGKKYPANICGLPFYKKSYVKGAN